MSRWRGTPRASQRTGVRLFDSTAGRGAFGLSPWPGGFRPGGEPCPTAPHVNPVQGPWWARHRPCTLAPHVLLGIPVTNLSVNPARSTGPALFVRAQALTQLWMFWVVPILGGAAGALAYRSIAED